MHRWSTTSPCKISFSVLLARNRKEALNNFLRKAMKAFPFQHLISFGKIQCSEICNKWSAAYCLWWKKKAHKFTLSTHNATIKWDWYSVFSGQTDIESGSVSIHSTAQKTMLEETAENREKTLWSMRKKRRQVKEDNISCNYWKQRKFLTAQSKWCEQSRVANMVIGKVEDCLQGSPFLWACRGDSSFETHFSGQKTTYIPHAFVLFWQRLVEGPLQPSQVSLCYKTTSERSSNVTERGESHWKW